MRFPSFARGLWAAASCLAFVAPAGAGPDGVASPRPLVIGHRGAYGYLPAHTLEGYALAIELGADFIEPDLVSTRDGHLIARHEPNLVDTTDVKDRPEFAARRRKAVVDGVEREGFFASDFTLAEIRRLRAVQDFAERPQQFNGRFEIPTFEEVIALAQRKAQEEGRAIGVCPETKHPTWHASIGLPLEQGLVAALAAAGWNRRDAPVFIQSSEPSNLRVLRRLTPVPLVQIVDANDVHPDGSIDFTVPFDRPFDWTASGEPELLARTFAFFVTDAGLREIKTYADGIVPWKRYVASSVAAGLPGPGEASRRLLPASDLIERAHAAGLFVHAWAFRNEPHRLASDYGGDPVEEYLHFYRLGVDGVFTEFPDTAVAARVLFELERDPDAARCLTGVEASSCRSGAAQNSLTRFGPRDQR
jgi:glycerophosphoryl diester phosphodiesterase